VDEETDNQPETSPTPAPDAEPHHLTRRERRSRKKMIILGAVAAAVLLIGGGAAYWFLLADHGDKKSTNTASGQEQEAEAPAPEVATDPTPETYKSEKLNLELTHRKDWTLKESAEGQITVTSPSISYTKSDNQATTGVFTVKIRKGATDAMKATVEAAVAPRDSEVIAYTAPSEQQRQYTNLSFAGQKDTFSFFIITGNTAFKAGNTYAYAMTINSEFYLITGGYGTDKTDALAFDSVPKEAIESEAYSEALAVVQSLKIY
jgi:hypothetical protein